MSEMAVFKFLRANKVIYLFEFRNDCKRIFLIVSSLTKANCRRSWLGTSSAKAWNLRSGSFAASRLLGNLRCCSFAACRLLNNFLFFLRGLKSVFIFDCLIFASILNFRAGFFHDEARLAYSSFRSSIYARVDNVLNLVRRQILQIHLVNIVDVQVKALLRSFHRNLSAVVGWFDLRPINRVRTIQIFENLQSVPRTRFWPILLHLRRHVPVLKVFLVSRRGVGPCLRHFRAHQKFRLRREFSRKIKFNACLMRKFYDFAEFSEAPSRKMIQRTIFKNQSSVAIKSFEILFPFLVENLVKCLFLASRSDFNQKHVSH